MRNDIKGKLQTELNKKIEGEPQVIYILSRVRKILEIDGKQEEYEKLKFYCDWALHSSINNIRAVRDIIDGIIARKGGAGLDLIIEFHTFHEEFKKFLKENNFTTTIYDSDENRFFLEMYLCQIYADTPLIVDGEIKISFFGEIGEKSFGGSFKIEKISMSTTKDTSNLIN